VTTKWIYFPVFQLPLIKKMLKHKPKERPTAEEIKDFVDNSSAH